MTTRTVAAAAAVAMHGRGVTLGAIAIIVAIVVLRAGADGFRGSARRALPGGEVEVVPPGGDAAVAQLEHPRHRQVDHFTGVTEGCITSTSPDPEGRLRTFPVEVDGDYIGEHHELELGIEPGALTVVA